MAYLCRFTFDELSNYLQLKKGDIKLGERFQALSFDADLKQILLQSSVDYILIGVPEDIGMQANSGGRKTSNSTTVWMNTLHHLINLQHNKFNKGNKLAILGHLDFSTELDYLNGLNLDEKERKKALQKLVGQIDKEVAHLVFEILNVGKIPIIIGGGQNNSYGAIKGSALSVGKPINAINFDAYSHFLLTEGRHSGNSFSYAFEEGFLKKYFIFGLHENHTTKSVLESIKKSEKSILYNTYEQIAIRVEKDFFEEITKALQFIEEEGFGIDIDLDATSIFTTKSSFSSGFHAREVRQFIHKIAKSNHVKYFHISEGSSMMSDDNSPDQVGKLIAVLITDFIKSNQEALQQLASVKN